MSIILPDTSGISSLSVLGRTIPKALEDNLIVSGLIDTVLTRGIFSDGALCSISGPVANISPPKRSPAKNMKIG